MSTILFMSAASMNDALGAAGRAHRPLFEALGYDCVEVNLAKAEAPEVLNRTVRDQTIEFVYGPMGVGADIRGTTTDGKDVNFWETNRIPYISLNGDSPAYFFDRHVMPSPWHACLYSHPEHLTFRRRLKPTPAIYGTIPPFPMGLTDKREIDFRKKERGKLLFLKNGNDPEKLVQMWREGMSSAAFVALAGLASELTLGIATESGPDIDAVVTEYFSNRGWEITEFVNLRLFFVAQLDDYLRRVKSTMMGKILAEFPVEIRGFNWEHVDFSGAKATFGPGIDYTETRARIIDSLGLIDMSPNTQHAPHDRPLRAFGLCTLCLTNVQKFFVDNFKEANTFSFRFEADHIRERVTAVLENPKRHVELGLEVAEEFRSRYRPEDFGQHMIDTASQVRLGCGPRPPGAQGYFVWPPTKQG